VESGRLGSNLLSAICDLSLFELKARMRLDSLQFPMAASKEKDTSYCQHRKSNRNGNKDTSCTGTKVIVKQPGKRDLK